LKAAYECHVKEVTAPPEQHQPAVAH
jgi:hypothetical protein